MGDIKNSIDESINWLLYSGIQNIGSDMGQYGGFNSWFDLDWKNYKYIYSEITGYGATVLSFLYERTGKKIFLERAILATDWLIGNALHPSGGVLTRYYLEADKEADKYSFDSSIIYAFDTGMALFGLAKLYKITGEEKYFEAIKKISYFLLTMQRQDGLFEPIYNAKTGQFINKDEKWSTQSGSFHAKLSLSLLEIYDILKDSRFKTAAERLCDAVLKFQKPEGRFMSFGSTGATQMHPHSYTCEGLYFAGKKLKNEKYLMAALKGTFWALHNQLDTGGVPCIYNETEKNINERIDTLAQVLRMAVYFTSEGIDFMKDYHSKINLLTLRLLEFQNKGDEQNGGFYYGCAEDGKKINHINSWCTMFAVQALTHYWDLLENKKIDIDYLV